MIAEAFNDEFDFGFSAVSEEELKAVEAQLATQTAQQAQEIAAAAKSAATAQQKLDQLYKAVMPLLNNLAKDDGKEYIYWPDRTTKIKQFIARVEAIVK